MKPHTSLLKSPMTPLARLLGVAGLAAALTLASPARADDFQTWQTISLKWLDTKYVDLTTAVHTRFTGIPRPPCKMKVTLKEGVTHL
jgi:hypothetical protein